MRSISPDRSAVISNSRPAVPDTNVVNMAREGLRIPLRTRPAPGGDCARASVQKRVFPFTGPGTSIDLTVEPLDGVPGRESLHDHVRGDGLTAAATGETGVRRRRRRNHPAPRKRTPRRPGARAGDVSKSSKPRMRSCNPPTRNINPRTKSWKPPRRNCSRSTKNWKPSTPSSTAKSRNSITPTAICRICSTARRSRRSFWTWNCASRISRPPRAAVFRLIPGDIGRPITDLAAQFADGDLVRGHPGSAANAGDAGAANRRRLPDQHYQMRILPYRTVNNVIDGVVITFLDVTQIKEAEQRAVEAQLYAENIVETVREPLLVLDPDLRVKSANKAFYETFQVSEDATIGKLLIRTRQPAMGYPGAAALVDRGAAEQRSGEGFPGGAWIFPASGAESDAAQRPPDRRASKAAPLILLVDRGHHRIPRGVAAAQRRSQAHRLRDVPRSAGTAAHGGQLHATAGKGVQGQARRPGRSVYRLCGGGRPADGDLTEGSARVLVGE